ncbi:methyl-accepting chemotaxis protein [Vibrio sp. SCSIO 43137]|uniref:methyl-accepting chemotaxis protein n=1 Tax=Vibrio sp. SCSIO 43137 TaxID=3021011 RepID=UPI002307E949|nr:methyl-accepting chemotaxis protein [Vibrio sp. SCSIO 43137]WCE30451.1 methyl-accepting chemotaxis protein [Vibrio sp. SCSIO 43137]
MKQIGFKKLLVLSVMLLVSLSVSTSSLILYLKEKQALTESITDESQGYVAAKAAIVETMINEKVLGINKLASQFRNKQVLGSENQIIEQTKFLANAMNLNSAVLAFESGDAYWNQSADDWPAHKFKGDVTTRGWYRDGRNANDVTVTEPYFGSGGTYWLTIIEKIKGGTISVDMKLEFLNELVNGSNDIPGAIAIILNQDTTFLASSYSAINVGEKGTSVPWFKDAALEAINKESSIINYSFNGQEKILFSHRIGAGDKNWYFAIGIDKSVAFAKLEESRNSAITVVVLSTIISAFIAFLVINILYKPVLALKDTITGLSQGDGDLTQRLKVTTTDELGQISKGVNQFIENLQSMMLEIQAATTTLQTNIGMMREQSIQNSSILQGHVSETEQIVTAIEEMNATASSMATDAANTASLTNQANETSKESRKIVEQSQQTVSALISDVELSSVNVQKMNNETQSINTILGVISEIAEQTNLLALNAAIEAARAGDQGRGFAVVADEVRNLASRTKDSTEEVENALNNLLDGSQAVVSSMENTKSRCQETAEGASEVAISLDTMTNYVDDINDLSSQIATAAEEQSSVTQELSRNMTAINEIVGELENNGRQALVNAEDVSTVNNQLVNIVSRFKL